MDVEVDVLAEITGSEVEIDQVKMYLHLMGKEWCLRYCTVEPTSIRMVILNEPWGQVQNEVDAWRTLVDKALSWGIRAEVKLATRRMR